MNSELFQPPHPLRPNLRGEFLIKSDLAFLNHGSFGAVPRVAFDEQNQWRERIEADPVDMIVRQGFPLLEAVKEKIGRWLGMAAADFGLVTNATEGINAVLRSLDFSPGDELLTTTHVYNAVRQAMKYVAGRAGATYREIELPLPVESSAAIEQTILNSITPATRLLVLDHITSPTALIFPVEKIVAHCKQMNVDVLIDGAHGPGMVPLDIGKLAPAYYAGNLHKWACAPRGSAFLWVRPDRQSAIHPSIISHFLGQGFAREFAWQGTRELSSWLTIPRSIEFFAEIGWNRVMAHNHAMAVWVNQMLCDCWHVSPISPADGSLLGSMATVSLPPPLDHLEEKESQALQARLHDEFRIEVPIMLWSARAYVRPCCQIYNVASDYQRLADAILQLASRPR